MSYTPTNWQTGDTITAEKLNAMDWVVTINVAADGSFVSASKTAEETWQAIEDGKNIRMVVVEDGVVDNGMGIVRLGPLGSGYWSFYRIAQNDRFTGKGTLEIKLADRELNTWDSFYSQYVVLNADCSLMYSNVGGSAPYNKVFGFNHMDPYPDWVSAEYEVTLEDSLSALITAAVLASGNGKVTLGADVSAMGETVYGLAKRAHEIMYSGKGVMVKTFDNEGYTAFNVISVADNGNNSANGLYAMTTLHGRAYHDFTNGISYDLTIELGARKVETAPDEYDYEAYAAVTAEQITITFIS